MIERTGRCDPRTVLVFFKESQRTEMVMKIFQAGGKDIFHRVQNGELAKF